MWKWEVPGNEVEIADDYTTTEENYDVENITPIEDYTSSPENRCRADDQIRCGDSNVFICAAQECDGKPDCPDEEDEQNCQQGLYGFSINQQGD